MHLPPIRWLRPNCGTYFPPPHQQPPSQCSPLFFPLSQRLAVPHQKETPPSLQCHLAPFQHIFLDRSLFSQWWYNRIPSFWCSPQRCQIPRPLVFQCFPPLLAHPRTPRSFACGEHHHSSYFLVSACLAPSPVSPSAGWVGAATRSPLPHTAASPACGLGQSSPLQLLAHPRSVGWAFGPVLAVPSPPREGLSHQGLSHSL